MSGAVYDPNFEFNAPKFHDFTNPTDDDADADTWFDGKEPDEAPGKSSARKGGKTPSKTPSKTPVRRSSRISQGAPTPKADVAADVGDGAETGDGAPAEEEQKQPSPPQGHRASKANEGGGLPGSGKENFASDAATAESTVSCTAPSTSSDQKKAGGRKSAASWRQSGANSRVDAKLMGGIMAMAGFKETEDQVKAVAETSLADAVLGDASIASTTPVRTARRSAGPSSANKPSTNPAPAPAATPASASRNHAARRTAGGGVVVGSRLFQPTAASEARSRLSQAPNGGDLDSSVSATPVGKRTRGTSATPASRASAKKARVSSQPEACTPTFSRFASSRSQARPSTAPRQRAAPSTMTTPRSSAGSAVKRQAWSASKPLPARKLTVPKSPRLASTSRASRRGSTACVAKEASRQSVGSSRRSSTCSTGSVRGLTVPVSPKLSGRSRSRGREAVGTEGLQLQQAQEAMEQVRKKRKVGEAKLKGVLEPRGDVGMAARSTKGLTVPKSPGLRTTTRGSTLNDSSASDGAAGAGGYQSLQDRLKQFDSTPKRFRKNRGQDSASPRSHPKPAALTNPKTPDFSKFRRKETKVQSASDREEAAVEEMKRSQFRARPLSAKVLESCGDLGVPKVDKKQLTNPTGPRLRSQERSEHRRSLSGESSRESLGGGDVSFEFKARPAPSTTKAPSSSSASSGPRQTRKLTIPTSPQLRTTVRSRSVTPCASEDDLNSSASSFKAAPMPDFSRTFVPKHDKSRLTEPAPFALRSDARGSEKEKEFSAKLKKQLKEEEEARKVKANPIRHSFDMNHSQSSHHEPIPLTETKPFNLQSDVRHEVFQSQFQEKVSHELDEESSRFSSFHARKAPRTTSDRKSVFAPQRSSKPLTEVQNVEFNVDRRTKQRAEFDSRMAEKEAARDARRRDEEDRRQEEEDQERRELRKSMVIKAKPVPSSVYQSSFEVSRSTQPLTEPASPQLRVNTRGGRR